MKEKDIEQPTKKIPVYAPIFLTLILPISSGPGLLNLSSEIGTRIILSLWVFWYLYNNRKSFWWEVKNNKIFYFTQIIADPILLLLFLEGHLKIFTALIFVYVPIVIYSLVAYKSYPKDQNHKFS